MTWHSKYCLEQTQRYVDFVADFEEKYPNYCKKCDGWGGKWERYDPSPAGVSLGSGYMEDFEPCEDCIDALPLKCPRCGFPYLRWVIQQRQGINFSPCPRCNWSEEDPDGIPTDTPECFCMDTCRQCEEVNLFNENPFEEKDDHNICSKCEKENKKDN
jgi:hypothetical protein